MEVKKWAIHILIKMDTNAIVILTNSYIDMSQKGNSDENYALVKSYTIKIEINEIIEGKTFGFLNPNGNTIEYIKRTKKILEDGEDERNQFLINAFLGEGTMGEGDILGEIII